MNYILIQNGNIVTENETLKKDILIFKNKIKKIDFKIKNYPKTTKIINALNKYIFPGAIDPHTHLELDLGKDRMSSDTFYSGSYAALQGGVTTLYTFAHQELKNETLLQAYKRRQKQSEFSINRCLFHSGIMNLTDDIEKQIIRIAKKGVKTFKIYLNSLNVNNEFLYRVFKTIAQVDGIALLHCEDALIVEYLKKHLHSNNKRTAKYIPESRPDYLELLALKQAFMIADIFKTKLYIVHLSTKLAAEFIRQQKLKKYPIYAETCPQYLLLTEEEYGKKNGYIYTCTPPFRKKEDLEYLWKQLKNETIEFIATDHCPFNKKQKEKFNKSFVDYVYGLPGVEISPVLMISEMRKRNFSYSKISRLLSTNISKLFGLYPEIGTIKQNSIADLFIYNPKIKDKISHKTWHMNSDFCQFENHKVNGQIETVIFNGRIVKNI